MADRQPRYDGFGAGFDLEHLPPFLKAFLWLLLAGIGLGLVVAVLYLVTAL